MGFTVEKDVMVVYQDCRGTFRSGGELVPMLNEATDGAGTVAWLAQARDDVLCFSRQP
jgi:uncharacterized protein